MQDSTSPNRTLDLASALEVGPPGSTKAPGENPGQGGCTKSVMTIAFQFAFEMHLQDNVASMARQYLRSIIASVQRVALALSPTNFGSHVGLRPPPGMPEAHTLTRWICQSYRLVTQNPNPSQTWTRICCTRQHMTHPTNKLNSQVLSGCWAVEKWRHKWILAQITVAPHWCNHVLLFEGK